MCLCLCIHTHLCELRGTHIYILRWSIGQFNIVHIGITFRRQLLERKQSFLWATADEAENMKETWRHGISLLQRKTKSLTHY